MILVTAANGNQGKLLIPALVASGVPVRACARSAESGELLRDAGVAEVVVGDLADGDVLRLAMRGVETVYYVGPALHPMERAMGFAAVDAAALNGVRHFVLSSALHPIVTDLIQHEIKRDIEEHLLSSDLEFTVLQPADFMLPHRLTPVFEEGVFRLSWSLDRYSSLIDVADVAEVARTVLLDPRRHAGATYELASPGRFTAHDLAAVCSAVVGRTIAVEQITADAFLRSRMGDPARFPYQLRVSRAISERYSRHDFVGNPNVATWLLGRTPTTWAEFVRRRYDAYRATAGTSTGG